MCSYDQQDKYEIAGGPAGRPGVFRAGPGRDRPRSFLARHTLKIKQIQWEAIEGIQFNIK